MISTMVPDTNNQPSIMMTNVLIKNTYFIDSKTNKQIFFDNIVAHLHVLLSSFALAVGPPRLQL
jgi:hypothetical protein